MHHIAPNPAYRQSYHARCPSAIIEVLSSSSEEQALLAEELAGLAEMRERAAEMRERAAEQRATQWQERAEQEAAARTVLEEELARLRRGQ